MLLASDMSSRLLSARQPMQIGAGEQRDLRYARSAAPAAREIVRVLGRLLGAARERHLSHSAEAARAGLARGAGCVGTRSG